ncbi:MAG TPA: glycoside hydrolase family 2 protein [Rhodanobacteraceae bacterium]
MAKHAMRYGRALTALLCAALLASWAVGAAAATPVTQSLDAGWQFRIAPGDPHAAAHPRTEHWLPAHVPGSVQTDLIALKLAPDPYWRMDEPKIQWVGMSNWQYRKQFDVDAATLARAHVDLVFNGLDTFADVYLNGHRILAADNMFRRWRVPVKKWLHTGANTLQVDLYSPVERILPWLLKQPYVLPGEFASPFGDVPPGKLTATYVRKAAYQYGWDWGPRVVTEGIWHPVTLQSWNTLRVRNFSIAQRHVDAADARLAALLSIDSDVAGPARVELDWRAPDGSMHRLERTLTLARGRHVMAVPFDIPHPERWWPVGYGKPNLYAFHVTVDVAGKQVAEAATETGLRSVVLRRRKDRWGKSFEFVVNGVPIFAKGASFVPMDVFPNRVTPARIDQMLESARDANMNMLRVWGGGYYLSNAFYTEADKLGLMVWQEFMFGGAIPPPDKAFRENVKQEAIQQVERLRDHPSVVIWVGNNEVALDWEGWHPKFKKSLTPAQRARIGNGLRELFGHTLRQVVAQYDPAVPYWPTSPGTDYEGTDNVTDNGDMHYWDVWSGKALPVSAYLGVTPRFMTEYGLQSMPVMATIDAFTEPSDRTPDSDVMRAHEKYLRGKHYDESTGYQRLLLYVEREFGKPKNLKAMVYLSQAMQAHGIRLAAEHLRASRPESMGSLYWQLDDDWPGTTWSSVDYYGRWKALQWHAKRFYAPLLIAALRDQGVTKVSLVSDRTTPVKAEWRLRVMTFAGKVLEQKHADVVLPPLSSTHVGKFSDADLLHGADPHTTFAVLGLYVDGKRVSRNLVFFGEPKHLALPVPKLAVQLEPGKAAGTYTVTVGSHELARDVWVSFGDLDATLSDNSFNLLPGESATLTVTSRASLAALRKALAVQDMAGVMATGVQ